MVVQILLLLGVVGIIRYWKGKYPPAALELPSMACLMTQAGVVSWAMGAYIWNCLETVPEVYRDFIGGFCPMYFMPKTFEYNAFYAGLLIFMLLLVFMQSICRDWVEAGREKDMRQIILYSLIPAAVMAGQSFLIRDFMLLVLPAALSAFAGMAVLIFCRPLLKCDEAGAPFAVLGSLYLFAASLYCAGLADNFWQINILTVAVALVFPAALYWAVKSGKWHRLLIAAQLGLPLGYLHLLDVRLRLGDGKLYDTGVNFLPGMIVGILVVISYVAILRKLKRKQNSLSDYVSSWAVLAFIS